MLNSLYEDAFPGLRFITFVNGRSRAEIVPELEVSTIAVSCFWLAMPFAMRYLLFLVDGSITDVKTPLAVPPLPLAPASYRVRSRTTPLRRPQTAAHLACRLEAVERRAEAWTARHVAHCEEQGGEDGSQLKRGRRQECRVIWVVSRCQSLSLPRFALTVRLERERCVGSLRF